MDSTFERYVAQVLDSLPDNLQRNVVNVAIVVEEWPDKETMELAGVDNPTALLGFYHGIPLTERTHDYGLVPPDKIILFRQPILMRCHNDRALRMAIQRTLRHELAHYFGISDERLDEMGAY